MNQNISQVLVQTLHLIIFAILTGSFETVVQGKSFVCGRKQMMCAIRVCPILVLDLARLDELV